MAELAGKAAACKCRVTEAGEDAQLTVIDKIHGGRAFVSAAIEASLGDVTA